MRVNRSGSFRWEKLPALVVLSAWWHLSLFIGTVVFVVWTSGEQKESICTDLLMILPYLLASFVTAFMLRIFPKIGRMVALYLPVLGLLASAVCGVMTLFQGWPMGMLYFAYAAGSLFYVLLIAPVIIFLLMPSARSLPSRGWHHR